MKLLPRERVVPTVVVLGLAAVLTALAMLQYRWSREVSEAASARMKASLQASMISFRQDLFRELAAVCSAFPVRPAAGVRDKWSQYAQQYQQWSRTAVHPELVANVFVLEAAEKHSRLMRLNPSSNQFEPGNWPPGFGPLAERLSAASSEIALIRGRLRPGEDVRGHPAGHLLNLPPGERAHPGAPWTIDQHIPALVHPLVRLDASGGRRARSEPPALDWLIIELNRKVLEGQVLPELAERYFSGPEGLEYEVAVVAGNDHRQVIYSSDAGFAEQGIAGADAMLNLFGGPPGPPRPAGGILLPGVDPRPGGGFERFRERHDARFGIPRFEPIRYSVGDRDWQLLAKHRKGSLDAVVAQVRRRNLAISFGVLLVLAATMAMIIIASQRAHRLAKLQMDFVAGVSHELRTPLAVISSAAENIADGVIDSKPQFARYGAVIKKQTCQLNDLVEQILLFAATRQNRLNYSLRPLEVEELINTALNHTAELIGAAGCTVERKLEPGLPPVVGDLPALSHCLQNLITNAVKYGGRDRWIGVRASAGPENGRGQQVRISIDDHGGGIKASELRHIFEPFYRSPTVAAAQIHGTGLGLTLARSIAEAMGGRLTVTSQPGKGTSFTLHLPAVDGTAAGAGAGEAAAGGS